MDMCENQIIMESRISATEAARRFSDLLNRVYYKGEEFVVERGGKPVCRIVPAPRKRFTGSDLARLWARLPKPDKGFWDDVEEAIRIGNRDLEPKDRWQR
jgi:prevent-host-death family protein